MTYPRFSIIIVMYPSLFDFFPKINNSDVVVIITCIVCFIFLLNTIVDGREALNATLIAFRRLSSCYSAMAATTRLGVSSFQK